MVTETEKKEFALSQLAPYLKDPNTCGMKKDSETCEYLTPEGKMCVAGKNMIEPKYGVYKGIDDLLDENDNEQEGLFKPEVVGILTNTEWNNMQRVHDTIAIHTNNIERLKGRIIQLNLFTYEELVERANSLE
jgi:hypothetical protein